MGGSSYWVSKGQQNNQTLLCRFKYLENMMKRSAGWGDLRAYMLQALQPLFDRLGFEVQLRTVLRYNLVTGAAGREFPGREATDRDAGPAVWSGTQGVQREVLSAPGRLDGSAKP